jgi:hypothetical protein
MKKTNIFFVLAIIAVIALLVLIVLVFNLITIFELDNNVDGEYVKCSGVAFELNCEENLCKHVCIGRFEDDVTFEEVFP